MTFDFLFVQMEDFKMDIAVLRGKMCEPYRLYEMMIPPASQNNCSPLL
jgi:hypothetical protein